MGPRDMAPFLPLSLGLSPTVMCLLAIRFLLSLWRRYWYRDPSVIYVLGTTSSIRWHPFTVHRLSWWPFLPVSTYSTSLNSDIVHFVFIWLVYSARICTFSLTYFQVIGGLEKRHLYVRYVVLLRDKIY